MSYKHVVRVHSVLIICPRPLVAEQKWQREMKRFDENFEHLDGKTLQYCLKEMHLDGEWPRTISEGNPPPTPY